MVSGCVLSVLYGFCEWREFAYHAKLNPALTMTVCLPHYPYKYATFPWYAVYPLYTVRVIELTIQELTVCRHSLPFQYKFKLFSGVHP
jgi:hypothetical protein